MRMLTPLARARGHGSAHEGVQHWYLQRASALLLIPLTAWLFYAMVSLSGADYSAALEFMASPLNSACAILLLLSGVVHAMLGVQVVIEDYVHQPVLEWVLLFAVKGLGYASMVLGVIYILRIASG